MNHQDLTIPGIYASEEYFNLETLNSIAKSFGIDDLKLKPLTSDETLKQLRDSFNSQLIKKQNQIRKSCNIKAALDPDTEKNWIKEESIRITTEILKDDPDFEYLLKEENKNEKMQIDLHMDQAIEQGLSPENQNVLEVLENFNRCSYVVQIHQNQFIATRNGEIIFSADDLTNPDQAAVASIVQIISICIEILALVVGICGLSVSKPSAGAIKNIGDLIKLMISQSKSPLKKALDILIEIFKNTQATVIDKANAIFQIVLAFAKEGKSLLSIVKYFFESMPWWSYAIAVVKTFAFIISLLVSGGWAFVAKVVLILADAVEFILKLINLEKISYLLSSTYGPKSTLSLIFKPEGDPCA